MKRLFLTVILGMLAMFSVSAADLVFHFDFKDAADKETVTDLTGKVKCHSENKIFVVQEDVLRLADFAQIFIPSESLPQLTEKFTFNIWLVKNAKGQPGPLFFKGLHPAKIQFLFAVTHIYPEFVYKNEKNRSYLKGIELVGTAGAHQVEYSDPKCLVNDVKPEITPGIWKMLTIVFDRGSIYSYLDGKLVLRKKSDKTESLEACAYPLYLGAERSDSKLNYRTANMLVNDWRLYDGVLEAAEIKKLYQSERAKYMKIVMKDPGGKYPDCYTYMAKSIEGYDPEFKNKLPLTAEYENNLPAQLPPGKGTTTSCLRFVNGCMGLFINNKEYFPMIYAFSNENQSIHEPRNPANFAIRNFAAADVPLFGTGIHPWRDMVLVWKGRKNYDFSSFDKVIREAIAANPTGHLQVTFFPEGIAWFQRSHNRELERCYPDINSSSKKLNILYQAPYGSDIWVECSSELLGDLVRYIEAQDYADRVYDYKLFCGGGGEWYWPGTFMNATSGYSEATRDSFREWLRKKYGSDDALQKAWNQPSVTLNSVLVPSPEFRFSSECFNFRDQFKARSVMDFREYMGVKTYDNIARNTKAMKDGCGSKKTVTIYYGYALFFFDTQNQTQYVNGGQMLGKVFRLPTVDNIGSPIDYRERLPGEPGGNINPFSGSALLHEKLLWQENDLRTHLYPRNEYGRTNNLEETCTVIRRGFGQALTNGMGFWWLPMPYNYAYNQEGIMREIKKIAEVSRETLKTDRSSIAEVALVFDEKSSLYLAFQKNNFIYNQTWKLYQNAFRMGAPFDAYLLEDIANPRMRDYKLYIFMNTYYTDSKIRNEIAAKVRKNNAVAVWCYAPGFITDNGFDEKTMFELTGFTLRHEMKENSMKLEITDKQHPLTRYAAAMGTYNVGPVIWSDDPDARVLGKAGGKDALAVKKFKDWTSVYTLMPLNKELLAGLCEFAGVHRFNKDYSVLTANKSYLMLHASSAGDKTIQLQTPSTVTEVFTGQAMGENVNNFTDKNVPAQATRIYRITPK
ncbi:MAG: LamG-like jellyroll fold domain-containing protein [Victivallaceae bacterium]